MTLMTLFDLVIILVVFITTVAVYKRRQAIYNIGATHAAILMLLGLGVIALFYLADLFTMHVLPIFMPMMQAMEIMKQLHLNASWFVMVAGVSFLVFGIMRLIHTVFPTQLSTIKTLKEQQEHVEQLALAKDDFFAAMSHELRTPLTAIIGNSELLAERNLDNDTRDLIHSIEISGKSQLALVNDILDLSKIEAGKFTIDDTPYNLNALIQDIRHMFLIKVQDVGIRFELEQKEHFTHQLMGDGQRVGQILINLIGNAVKFTDEGSVILSIWRADDRVHFSIEDTGIGMPPEVVRRLFQRFEQGDRTITRRFGGTGLGLYISYCLADLMEGQILVESEVGKGSTFTLILPYRPSELMALPKEENLHSNDSVLEERFEGKVLIAEDTPELQILERRIVESMGLEVVTASDGQQALNRLAEEEFDAVLMDMQMPVMDGIEATRAIRAADNPVPVIALTANVMQKHQNAFSRAGCDNFLMKPIDKQELRRVLKQYVRRRRIAA